MNRRRFVLIILVCSQGIWVGDLPAGAATSTQEAVSFGVYWPPRNPDSASVPGQPLLLGKLAARYMELLGEGNVVKLVVTLERKHDEAGRTFWNSRLAFPEYEWMRQVRVWDTKHKWLWPNLPYLLRLYGIERVERYGGIDPGKGIDNDFAAVLIRKFEATGEKESDETKRTPLVSAEWHPVGVTGEVDKETVVHVARSDEFTVHIDGAKKLGVWLIYADFLGRMVPTGWPKTPEFAGGILAYFDIDWELKPNHPCKIEIHQRTPPPRGTGFDWSRWAVHPPSHDSAEGPVKLTDRSVERK